MGKGTSNGSFKGQRFFTCPDACALFTSVSHIRVRHWSRERDRNLRNNNNHPSNGHHSNDRPSRQQQSHSRPISVHHNRPSSPPQPIACGFIPRTAESAPITAQVQNQVRTPTSPPPFHVGQRLCFPLDDGVHGGEVRFCGLLFDRPSSGMYVGVLLVSTTQEIKL